MAKHIVSIGDLVIDLVLDVELPIATDRHQMSTSLQFEPGGAANTIIAARHMGLDVAALGTVGADFQGEMLKSILDQKGVDTSALVIPKNSSTTTVIALTDKHSHGHVFLGHYGIGDPISLTAAAQTILFQCDAVFMPGYTLVEERLSPLVQGIFAHLERNNIPFYFDVGPYLEQLSHSDIESVIRLTDILFLTKDEIPFVTRGQTSIEACKNLLQQYPNMLIVLKTGASGCQIMSQQTTIECQGYSVDVVDTVGAGDSFAGAFMWAHLNGASLEVCGKIANAMGAASVQKMGGGRNTPTLEEVQSILNINHVGIDL